ncbi:MAG: hypothetical protein EOO96_04670 [Pedobacter sp.]|nr:MAG: hypothetical protein EOO96_04670 [Pedobacter sp.]
MKKVSQILLVIILFSSCAMTKNIRTAELKGQKWSVVREIRPGTGSGNSWTFLSDNRFTEIDWYAGGAYWTHHYTGTYMYDTDHQTVFLKYNKHPYLKNVLNENETINNTVALEPSVSKLKKAQLATANQKQKIKKDRSLTVVNILRAPSTFGDSIQLVSTDNHKKVDVIVQKEIDEAKSHWSFAGIFLSSDDTSKDDKYNKPVDVTVIGYGLKSISQSKIIRFRGVPADSIKRSTDGSFIINGEIVDREKLNSIDPNTIKTITVVGRPRIK